MSRVRAVLFDRDGTLVEDVPYNGDPAMVRPLPGVRRGLDALRERGLLLGVVTNQSGVGRGLISMRDVEAVNAQVERELGPFAGWFVCPHAPGDGCDCRKPQPRLIVEAARAFGIEPREAVMVGDKPSDAQAAHNAGAGYIDVADEAGGFEAAIASLLP